MIPQGFLISGVRCGLKNKRNDVGMIVSQTPARAAGVFTSNQTHAASIDVSREAVRGGMLSALVVNSGNANCCTGEQGVRDTLRTAELAAEVLGVTAAEIAVASTGVIGQPLDMKKLEKGVREAATALGSDPRPFMEAILTTDLVEKWARATWHEEEVRFQDRGHDPVSLTAPQDAEITAVEALNLFGPAGPALAPVIAVGNDLPPTHAMLYGVAKGSGMIAPNMATMLGFLMTDLDLEGVDLDAALRKAVEISFNATTVDGDTSTNDMVLILANGASGIRPNPDEFQLALNSVCISLAKQIARDGEGATKLVEVTVRGSEDPKRVARTIAESPLVKTAMFGCDPNWGRIIAAAGRSGVAMDPNAAVLTLSMQGEEFLLFRHGTPTSFDPARVSAALKADHVKIHLDLGPGETATVYTCDFGYGYVRINAEYHT